MRQPDRHNYKFKNWQKTAGRNLPVTEKMKTQRAEEIAKKLNDTDYWHSHGHGISMDVLRHDLNLQIEDFGAKLKLREAIRSYHRLLVDYMGRVGHIASVHTQENYVPIATK